MSPYSYQHLLSATDDESALVELEEMKRDPINSHDKSLLQAVIYDIKNDSKCYPLYNKLIKDGNIHAMLAFAISKTKDFTVSNKRALRTLKRAILTEDKDLRGRSKRELGRYYRDLRKDYQKAKELFLEAVDDGYIYAMISIGWMMFSHLKDYDQAIQYYNKALELDIPNVNNIDLNIYYWIAQCYQRLKDYDNMKKYYIMDIEDSNNLSSMLNLAKYYYYEEKDLISAVKYIIPVAEKGNENAIYALISYYKKNKQYDQMIHYYRILIDKGYKYSLLELTDHYIEQQQYQDAINCLLTMQDDEDVLFKLGLCYEHHLHDYDNAIKYYIMASNKGCSVSTNNLGNIYLNVKKDCQLSEKYYKMSLNKGYVPAWLGLGTIQCQLKNYGKAIFNYQRVLDNKHKLDKEVYQLVCAAAFHNLAVCCFNKKEYDIALEYCFHSLELEQKESVELCIYIISNNKNRVKRVISFIQGSILDNKENKNSLIEQLVSHIIDNRKTIYDGNYYEAIEDVITLIFMSEVENLQSYRERIISVMITGSDCSGWFNYSLPKIKAIKSRIHLNEDCPICLTENIVDGVTLYCHHQYCYDCLAVYCRNNHKCPLCKGFIR